MLTNQENKAFELVETKQEKSTNMLTPLFKRFNELENLYWFYTPKSQKSYKSNVFDPMAFEQVEHTVSHLFANDPKGTYIPMEPSDEIAVDAANELFKYQWNKPGAESRKKMVNMGRNFSIFGIAFGELGWRYERPFSKLYNKFITTWDDPYFKDLNVYDCWPDVDARTPEDMEYFGYDEYLTPEQIYAQDSVSQGVKRYKNLDQLKKLVEEEKSLSASDSNAYRDNAKRKRDLKTMKGGDENGRVLVRRYKTREKWITILPDYKLVIEDRANPYAHGGLGIHVLTNHDYPNMLYGIGELDPIRSMLIAHNQVINMRLDNVRNILQPPFQAKYSAMRHKPSWKFGPNALWTVDQIGDIQTFNIPDVTGSTFANTTNFFQDSISRRMGRTDFLSRNETDNNRTATEIKAMVGEQNARLRYKEKNIDDFIQKLAVEWMQLNQQFLKKDRLIRILGVDAIESLTEKYGDGTDDSGEPQEEPKFKRAKGNDYGFFKVSPEEIQGALDFQVESGSTRSVDLEGEIQNLNSAIKLGTELGPVLQQEGVQIKFKPLLEDVYRRLGIKNTDKVFESLDMQPQMQDQQQLLNDQLSQYGQEQQQPEQYQ